MLDSNNNNSDSAARSSMDSQQWLLKEWLTEQKRKRRWSVFFRLAFLLWLTLILYQMWTQDSLIKRDYQQPHTALIEINGEIGDHTDNNADDIIASLNRAFDNPKAAGIILRINSGGGTPVTADYIYHEIIRLKEVHPKQKIYTVCADVCASAAYYIASATHEIYANPSSFVGSIAVLFNGYGFVNIMEKIGIERRIFTSAEHKGFLDPFSPIKENEALILKSMLKDLHQQFVNDVKAGRGQRLKEHPDLFSGLYWTGGRAKELGLIDGFGSDRDVARDVIKEPNTIIYQAHGHYIDRLFKKIGASLSHTTQLIAQLIN